MSKQQKTATAAAALVTTATAAISFSELMAEIEKFRPTSQKIFSKEQDQFLLVCRDHAKPVMWKDMIQLWERAGWGKTSEAVLRRRMDKLKRNN